MNDVPVNPWKTTRAIALLCAVIHHGLSNFASESVPARWNTTLQTADKFDLWLNGQPTDRNGRGNGGRS